MSNRRLCVALLQAETVVLMHAALLKHGAVGRQGRPMFAVGAGPVGQRVAFPVARKQACFSAPSLCTFILNYAPRREHAPARSAARTEARAARLNLYQGHLTESSAPRTALGTER